MLLSNFISEKATILETSIAAFTILSFWREIIIIITMKTDNNFFPRLIFCFFKIPLLPKFLTIKK